MWCGRNWPRYLSTRACPACEGTRLNPAARHVYVAGQLAAGDRRPAGRRGRRRSSPSYSCRGGAARSPPRSSRKSASAWNFLVNVGLDYLTLERSADTLSGGEAQRIRLASQIGAGLVGVMYVLDEPSIGLHQRDNAPPVEQRYCGCAISATP